MSTTPREREKERDGYLHDESTTAPGRLAGGIVRVREAGSY
jgi:hypothetical protein